MERINDWFTINIEYFILNGINNLNYYVYKMEWPIIIIGFIMATVLISYNKKKYYYRYEVSRCIKTSLLIIITAYFILKLNIEKLTPIFDTIFYNFMPVTIWGIILGYIFDKFIFYKYTYNNNSTEIRHLKYTIGVTYVFLLISSMYEVKDILLPVIWQINLISIKFLIENKEYDVQNHHFTLYETRKKQLDILKDIIRNSRYEDYAIAITGEWGSGKSELITALIDDCNKDNNSYIYIRPMISDTKEILIGEFQKSISKLMKRQGIYSGRNSSVDKYFKEISKLVQFNSKVTLSDFMELFSEDSSYKDFKKELQDDIDLLLDKKKFNYTKKLMIIVDDFDRVDENKQIEILSFIKEVIDFKGCITIIALDYENLKTNKVVNTTYLEKFIGTHISIVDIEFEEIVEVHSKYILKEDFLENYFSRSILQEINNNLKNYHKNIFNKTSDLYDNEEENISNNKDENTNESDNYLNELWGLCVDSKKLTNNSRRVIHFLKEIQNSLVLLDQLYKDRVHGKGLLNMVKVSQVLYVFNYIKVFHKEIYESLMKTKGIEEYFDYLLRENKEAEEKFLRIILKDLVPESRFAIQNENDELITRNTYNLIKDMFIDYHFTKNNIELLTDSEKIINEIDKLSEMNKDNLVIEDNYLEKLNVYQRTIFSYSNNKEEILNRILYLIDYIIVLYKKGKIDFSDILQMATYRNNYRNWEYTQYYLKEAVKLVDEPIISMTSGKDKRIMESTLNELERENIIQYRYSIIQLLIVLELNEGNDKYIQDLIGKLEEINLVFQTIKKYSIDKGLIKEQDNIVDLRVLLKILLDKVKDKEYEVIQVELLDKRLQTFLLNYEYISKLRKIKVNIGQTDKYKELSHYLSVENIDEAKTILKELSKEEVMNDDMISCFQQLIRYIVNQSEIEKIDEELRTNVNTIFKKINKEHCWNENVWFDIMINVERIVNIKR